MDRTHSTSGGEEKFVQGFVGLPQRIERLREKPERREEDAIQMDLSEVRWDELE
jgi:hypothetical protein